MQISMKTDIRKGTSKLHTAQRKQIPFATAKALTSTAWDVAREETRQVPIHLDKPISFTKKAFNVIRAAKTKLVATVLIKPIQAAYLGLQIKGGTRNPKGRAVVVPANLKLNQYGNMPKGKIQKLLADPRNFSGKVHGIGGIWQRNKDGGLTLLVSWENETQYQPRFPFFKIGEGKARAVFGSNLRKALTEALRSAK